MQNDRVSDIGEEVFISYLGDSEEIVNGYVVLVSISDNLITFKTNKNLITIPTSRLIKLKRKGE